jgi:RNA polymerase sigma factor (sigma-70 family)
MLEDAQLFKEAQQGSSVAFGQLVRRHEAHVGAVVIARMRQTTHVDDVVQEAFVAAWVRRESLREPEKFRAWVCGIARNQAAKVHRRESRALEAELASNSDNAEERLLRNESTRALTAAVEALPEDDRELIVLFYREGQSIREIAGALSLSEAAAQKRISRARDSIKASVRSLLSDVLPTTKTAAGVSAAVLASITTGLGAATANATANSSISTSSTIAKGSPTMKIVAALTTLAAFAGGGAIYSHLSDSESAEAAGPRANTKAATPVVASAPAPTPVAQKDAQRLATAIQLRRISRKERAERFALHKSANTTPAAAPTKSGNKGPPFPNPPTGDRDIIKSTIAAVRPLIVECYELAQIGDPVLEGMVAVRFHISDEAEIAGLVTEAEVSRRKGRFHPPNTDFEQCLEETMLSLEFIGMSRGLSVTYPFIFRLAEGAAKAPQRSGEDLRQVIDETEDAERLVDLAEEVHTREPGLSTVACRKAISLEPSMAHAFTCTLQACRSGQKDEALEFWTTASKFAFGASLASLANKTCSDSQIKLPQP